MTGEITKQKKKVRAIRVMRMWMLERRIYLKAHLLIFIFMDVLFDRLHDLVIVVIYVHNL